MDLTLDELSLVLGAILAGASLVIAALLYETTRKLTAISEETHRENRPVFRTRVEQAIFSRNGPEEPSYFHVTFELRNVGKHPAAIAESVLWFRERPDIGHHLQHLVDVEQGGPFRRSLQPGDRAVVQGRCRLSMENFRSFDYMTLVVMPTTGEAGEATMTWGQRQNVPVK